MMCLTLTGNCVGHWLNCKTSAGNRFLYLFSQNAPHYPQPASITSQLSSVLILIHPSRRPTVKTDQTDHFWLLLENSISGHSRGLGSAISGLTTELIIQRNNFPPLGQARRELEALPITKLGYFSVNLPCINRLFSDEFPG